MVQIRLARIWPFGVCAAALVAMVAAVTFVPPLRAQTHPLCMRSDVGRGQPQPGPAEPCAIIETTGADGPRRLDDPAAWPTDAVRRADLLLLGEVHDNPAHHRLRSQLILALAGDKTATRSGRTALVFEHIRTDQHLALAAFRAVDRQRQMGAAGLLEALQWETSGWPAAAMFEPLFAAALDLEWPILPGNLSRADIRNVARGGLSAAPAEEVARLGLERPLPPQLQAGLLDELEASHCGLMPRTAFGGMADAQRFRDAHMAHVMVDAATTHGRAILLAGNGHVRADRGVPWHLEHMAPERRRVAILYVEVTPDNRAADAYVERRTDGSPIADYVVLTARAERPDPCTEMRRTYSRPAR